MSSIGLKYTVLFWLSSCLSECTFTVSLLALLPLPPVFSLHFPCWTEYQQIWFPVPSLCWWHPTIYILLGHLYCFWKILVSVYWLSLLLCPLYSSNIIFLKLSSFCFRHYFLHLKLIFLSVTPPSYVDISPRFLKFGTLWDQTVLLLSLLYCNVFWQSGY